MAPVRQALHDDKDVCTYLIKSAIESKPLSIAESKIARLGSGLVADEAIDQGRQIFKSKPFITCVDPRFDSICHYCLKGSEKLPLAEEPTAKPLPKACSGCRKARFCSKDCQTQAWKLFHRDECKILCDSPTLTMSHLALYRILFWQKSNHISDKVAKALSLVEDHFDEYTNTERGDHVYELVSSIRNTANPKVALSVVLRLLPAIQTNAIKMRQAEKSGSFGIALDLLSCAINHSCDPNAFLYVEDGYIIARSLRDIAAGEEVTISYVDPMHPLKPRRDLLDMEYFFLCFCKRCEADKRELKAMVGHTIHSLKGLYEAQDTMVKLINNTVVATNKPGIHKESENIEKMQVDILTVAGQAMKDGNWPEHLDPMPLVRNTLAWLYLNKQDAFAATRNALRGTLMRRHRNGPDWVNNLCTLTQCLAAIAANSPDAPFFSNDTFLTLKETQTAVRGYGMRLCKDAGNIFGGKSRYTEFLCDWFSWIAKAAEDPKPGTKEFDALFWEAQKKLLAWADVDLAYCVDPGEESASWMADMCARKMERMKIAAREENPDLSDSD
ncbi:SET domain-containing protein [Coniochaeta ligniaria NRRL 30616]|uniref:SET domain-containing protein n=1 Tax=Coniochaeta ligniaria NRRL 30616 TaxID=1408157 RepID=A0A1J7JF92_9PEZI|nr:SET domain-containing protein [Coniochaeta ligniaria NRRL 30616]